MQYNNDPLAMFPSVFLVEGESGTAPDLSEDGMVLSAVSGEALSWSILTLPTPVTSTTGTAYAVFLFPPHEERTAEGDGGGPGIGYRRVKSAPAAFVSFDGYGWLQLHQDYALAVEPVVGMMKGGAPVALSELGDRLDLPEPAKDDVAIPTITLLQEPYPNPFNPQVRIAFDLATPGRVELKLYNVRGQLVRSLVSRDYPAGSHGVLWMGDDARGRSVASGVYYARMVVNGQTYQKAMTLVR